MSSGYVKAQVRTEPQEGGKAFWIRFQVRCRPVNREGGEYGYASYRWTIVDSEVAVPLMRCGRKVPSLAGTGKTYYEAAVRPLDSYHVEVKAPLPGFSNSIQLSEEPCRSLAEIGAGPDGEWNLTFTVEDPELFVVLRKELSKSRILNRKRTDVYQQVQYLLKGTVDCIPEHELRRKLDCSQRTGVPLWVKAGFDPTAPDLHLGHTVLIRKMRHFQQLGHHVIFLIGDFTGMIGDPSGRSRTRPPLTAEQIKENAETYKRQIFKLLDPERTEICFNRDWFSTFSTEDFIHLAAKATVAQLLERDDFSKRFQTQTPISLHELLYPLVQGYDSVALEADVELGGTDQKFNLLMARQVQQAYGVKEPQLIMTTPLLEGLDGVQKMSKSLDNYIGITESPTEIFGKLMSISDDLMWRYYELLTDFAPVEIDQLKQAAATGERHPRDLKAELGRRIVTDFHSQSEAQEASDEFDRTFREHQAPSNIHTVEKPIGAVKLVKLLASEGLAASVSDAQRLMGQGSVRLNGERVSDVTCEIGKTASEVLIQVGKRKFLRLVFE